MTRRRAVIYPRAGGRGACSASRTEVALQASVYRGPNSRGRWRRPDLSLRAVYFYFKLKTLSDAECNSLCKNRLTTTTTRAMALGFGNGILDYGAARPRKMGVPPPAVLPAGVHLLALATLRHCMASAAPRSTDEDIHTYTPAHICGHAHNCNSAHRCGDERVAGGNLYMHCATECRRGTCGV